MQSRYIIYKPTKYCSYFYSHLRDTRAVYKLLLFKYKIQSIVFYVSPHPPAQTCQKHKLQ
jgi:hypothetical protein